MTACSNVAALGMMPLLLYIFCKGFSGLENAVPYGNITKSLVLTLVPCAIGILINHYRPNYSPIVKKARLRKCASHVRNLNYDSESACFYFCRQVGLSIFISSTVIVSILAAMAFKDLIWMIFMPDVLLVASLMPLIGFMLGYIMSVICRLSPK